MLDLLRLVADVVTSLPQLVLWAIVSGVNLVIAALGVLIGQTLGRLPAIPSAPAPPDSGVLQWLAYVYPLGGQLALLAAFVACWIAFLVVRIPLRWVKAL